MPGIRHLRLALLAVSLAVVLALAPRAPQADPNAPVGPELAVAAPTIAPFPRGESRAPRPDPDGPRDEGGDVGPPSPAALTGYVWPLPKGRLTQAYGHTPWGSRIVEGRPFHDGIDLATFCGDRIVAAHDGVVLAAGRRFDAYLGWQGDLEPYFERLDQKKAWGSLPIVVVIDDGNGYRSVYAHLQEVAVEKGERVRAGQLLGREGATGRASGCHLHYALFSPLEQAVSATRPDVVESILLPPFQTARIDPLLVLPDRAAEKPTSGLAFPTARPATVVPSAPAEPLP